MLKLIAAVSQNHQIGIDHHMPWHIPEDLNYFKEATLGHTVIMGRKTFESIGRPLPGRRNIVLTRNPSFSAPSVEVLHTVKEVLSLRSSSYDFFVIGGGEIYRLFLPYADQLYLTLIEANFKGDTSFPSYEADFKCVSQSPLHYSLTAGLYFSYTIWQRK